MKYFYFRWLQAIALCIIPCISYSQNGYTTIERVVLDRALTVLEDYEVMSAIPDDDTYYMFIDLFTSENAPVYNDIMGHETFGKSISVKDYADYLLNEAKSTQSSLLNIKKKRLWQEDGIWKIEYEFEKNVNYSNKCGILFSNQDFFDNTAYAMTAVLRYDPNADICKIEHIDGKMNSNKQFPENSYTFIKTNERDPFLKFKGKTMTFNSYNQAFLSANVKKHMFSYADADVIADLSIDDGCKTVTADYKTRRFSIKPYYSLGVGKSSMDYYGPALSSFKGKSSEFGLEFGYSFPNRGWLKFSLFTGAGMTLTNVDMSYASKDYAFNTPQDVNGLTYIRHYRNLTMNQTLKLSELTVPLYLELRKTFANILSVYLDLGAAADFTLSKKISNLQGSAYAYGIYPQFNNLYMDEHWGFNGFGNVEYTMDQLNKSNPIAMKSISFDALVGGGIQIHLGRLPIAIDAGVRYRRGLMDILVNKTSYLQWPKPKDENSALVFNTINGLDSSEHAQSLTEVVKNMKRNLLVVRHGLVFRF